jgi:hypothetical protein
MRDALAERLRFHELRVHVVRKEIPCMSRVHDKVRLGNRAAKRRARGADLVVLKVDVVFHDFGLRVFPYGSSFC